MRRKHTSTRRSFLKSMGMAGAGLVIAGRSATARSYSHIVGSNERFNVGIIGCGAMAGAHLSALLRMPEAVDVVAVSDVFDSRARNLQDQIWKVGGRPERFDDYRMLLERNDLDYVLIATPGHWHGQIALDALDAGLHVYVEKPMTHLIREGFAVVDKVRDTGRKLQVGVQGMSDDSYESAHAAIAAGKLGPVIEAQIDYVRGYDEIGPWRSGVDPDLPKPDDLDWDMWLGPATKRPWDARRFFEWRNYRDYSGGIATDLFIHRLTRILKAVGLGFPERVVGMGGIYLWDDGRELPDNMEMLLEYPAIEDVTPGMTVHILGTMGNGRGVDHLIRGDDATLVFTREGWDIIEEGSGEIIEQHVKTGAEDVTLHYQNLHAAIRDGAPLRCDAELGLYGVVAVNGGNQSWFEKKMLAWGGDGWTS